MNVDVGDEFCLALRGRDLSAEDRRVLGAFAAQAAAVLEHHRLALAAEAGKPAAEAGQAKGALFATISNDMRGPLAVTTAAASSLRAPDATWTAPETAGLLASAAESLGQLTRLAGNLLEMSGCRRARCRFGRGRQASPAPSLTLSQASDRGRPR